MIVDKRLQQIINEYALLGQRVASNGVRLVGHVPHRGSQAYLHILFPPVEPAWITELQAKLIAKRALEEYAAFLSEHNGAIFFLGSLALNGIRRGLISRSVEERQPFDIGEMNVFERPKNADLETLYVGSYNWDGSLIYLEPNGEVLVCRKGDSTPYAKWPSLREMLSQELPRLAQFYDGEGRVIDKTAQRTPPPNIK